MVLIAAVGHMAARAAPRTGGAGHGGAGRPRMIPLALPLSCLSCCISDIMGRGKLYDSWHGKPRLVIPSNPCNIGIKLIVTLGRGLALGAVFAHDVGNLTPAALRMLDDGLRVIARSLVPPNSPQPQNYQQTLYTTTSALLNRVGLRMGLPGHMGDSGSRYISFNDRRNDRNARLEHCLIAYRSWAFQAPARNLDGHLGCETLYQLIKFRGIDLNAPDPI